MIFELPKSLAEAGVDYTIRSDYRVILELLVTLGTPDLENSEKSIATLITIFPDYDTIPPSDYKEALDQCVWFINGGEAEHGKPEIKRLMDWEQDYPRIVSPINRILGFESRSVEYLHWWTWLSAYFEIGDCLFAQIVNIRAKKAKGKKLDKSEQEFYRHNRDIIDIKGKYTEAEQERLMKLLGR